ncbi:MAG TPA: flagellar biosynthesis protein FlhB [Candidatus Brocadiia bacterium]|nr:flagellar biosynthesis protein FlhB [Candidatus Brocadiales bacterium]
MSIGAHDRTEKPTGKRLSDARAKGQVAKSPDINSAAALLCGLLVLYYAGAGANQQIGELMKMYLGGLMVEPLTMTMFNSTMVNIVGSTTKILLPIVGGLLVAGVAASLSQVGFLITFQQLKPNLGLLNPIKGFKNIFVSMRSLVRFAMSLAKLAIVAAVAFYSIKSDFDKFLDLTTANLAQIFTTASYSIFWLGIRVAIILLFLAILDYAYQKWQHVKDLMMTKQEVKDELKQTEGDPVMKGRIRAIQRQWAMRRMMAAVPQADVVVTNPLHLAIALMYDSNTMKAPKVVAKGADLIAKRIVKIARENNVPIFEDKPLAHAIFKTVEIGYEIPQKLYHAVAKVLSYIYKLRGTYKK